MYIYIHYIYIYVLWQNMPSQFTILYKLCVAGSSTRSSPWRAVVAFLYQTESDMPRSVVAIATWPAGQCCTTALAYRPWKRSLLHGWLPFKAARNGWCWRERFWLMSHKFWNLWAAPATLTKTSRRQRTSCRWSQRSSSPSRAGEDATIGAHCGATSLRRSSEAGRNVHQVDLEFSNSASNLAPHRSSSARQRALFDPMPQAAAENWVAKFGHSWGQKFEGAGTICTGGTCCWSSFTPQRNLQPSPMQLVKIVLLRIAHALVVYIHGWDDWHQPAYFCWLYINCI